MQKYRVYFWKYLPKKYFIDIKEKYKNRKNDYMNIYVCDTKEEMYELENKLEGKHIEEDYVARTWCYSKNWYDSESNTYIKTSSLCGHIVFNKEYFFMNAITHESTHAVIGYFNRKLRDCQKIFTKCNNKGDILEIDVPPENDLEELFCYMIGNIADQIVCKYKE